jgi:hypothetical protein
MIVTQYLRVLCLKIRWKILDIAINVVSGVIIYVEALSAIRNVVWYP